MKFPSDLDISAESLEEQRRQLPYRIKELKGVVLDLSHKLDRMRAIRATTAEANERKALRAKLGALSAVLELAEAIYQNTGIDGNDQLRCEILTMINWACHSVLNGADEDFVPFCRRYRIATGKIGLWFQAKDVDTYHKNLVITGVAAVTYVGLLALPIYAPLAVPHTFSWLANEFRKIHVQYRGTNSTPKTQGTYYRSLRKFRNELRELEMPAPSAGIDMEYFGPGPISMQYEYSVENTPVIETPSMSMFYYTTARTGERTKDGESVPSSPRDVSPRAGDRASVQYSPRAGDRASVQYSPRDGDRTSIKVPAATVAPRSNRFSVQYQPRNGQPNRDMATLLPMAGRGYVDSNHLVHGMEMDSLHHMNRTALAV